MNILRSIVPYRVDPEYIKFYNTTNKVYYLGLISHAGAAAFFYYMNVSELFLFGSIISVPSFIVALVLNRLGKLNLAFVIAFFELYFHQIFAVYFLGWDMGFQYWLIYLVGLGFLNPRWGKKVQILQIVLFIIGFSTLYLFFKDGLYILSPQMTMYFYFANAICSITVLAILINSYSRAAHVAEKNLKKVNAELNVAHQETRNLLLNILPESIADRLTGDHKQIADTFDETSIIFCDLVGFTEMSSTKKAEDVVSILNGIFYEFDSIVEKMGLEKIKTIGDGYMVASGVPEKKNDHALSAVLCAEEMLQFLETFNEQNKLELKLRVGIHSGRVVAGVIGKNKFTYDLWGDTVNTAARMESHGVPGKIHISAKTYNYVKNECKAHNRGLIKIKGKGMMETYLVDEVL